MTETVAFADHVSYDVDEVSRLKSAAAGADVLVTTEKDAVKLAGEEFGIPCYQVPLVLEIEKRDDLMTRLEALAR